MESVDWQMSLFFFSFICGCSKRFINKLTAHKRGRQKNKFMGHHTETEKES